MNLLILLTLLMFDGDGGSNRGLAELKWMSGSWAGSADGVVMEEYWTEPGGGIMLAVHRDIHTNGKMFFEFLRIEESEDGLTYLGSPRGRPATRFPLESISEMRVVFANPAHDFPKRIIYWRSGAELCAASRRLARRQRGARAVVLAAAALIT